MKFSEQIKMLREEKGLTQEQLAERLNITRQAVSNWENGRNLPDIEMLIGIKNCFGISLDELILPKEEQDMSPVSQKLIKDGSETRRAKFNVIATVIGAALILIGISLLLIRANTPEYIDADGTLHEAFFLVVGAFAAMLAGFIVLISSCIYGIFSEIHRVGGRTAYIITCAVGLIAVLVGGILVLMEANSGRATGFWGLIIIGGGLILNFLIITILIIRKFTSK